MRLYTICIDQRPVLVISAGAKLPTEDTWATNPENLVASSSRSAASALTARALWDGDRARLHIREAHADEAEQWHRSHRAAIDAFTEDHVAFLVRD